MNQYPPEALNAALEKGIAEGLLVRPADEAALAQALASLNSVMNEGQAVARKITEAQWEERLRPIEASTIDAIPFDLENLLFLEGRAVDRGVTTQIVRFDYQSAVCIIGPVSAEVQDAVRDLIMVGHRVYMLPRDTDLVPGCRLLQPPEHAGISLWRHVVVE